MEFNDIRQRILLIADGVPLKVGNITIKIEAGKSIVTYWTETYHLKNVSEANSIIELGNLKKNFLLLIRQFEDLQNLIHLNDLKIEYYIAHDTGKSAVYICEEIDGKFSWHL